MYSYVCLNCKTPFQAKNRDRRFCSQSCSTTYSNHSRRGIHLKFSEESLEKRRTLITARNKSMIGAKHPNWKGGQFVSDGYVYIYTPTHPHANAMGSGYMKRSRLVMEAHLGRYLTKNELTHHINENTQDDIFENLELKTKQSHTSHHIKQRKQSKDPATGRFAKEAM